MEDVYIRLAKHLGTLIMGYPFSDDLIQLLKETYTLKEAQVALAIPNNLAPLEVVDLETVAARSALPHLRVKEALKTLSSRNMLYTATTPKGTTGYALLQVGYGIPQTFFWGGQQDERAKRMAQLVIKYFTVPTTRKIYGGSPTKTYTYSPASLTVNIPMQGVLPNEQISSIVDSATTVAVAHCPCRLSARILGRTDCTHSLEVCIKYDDMAEFVIDRGLARKLSKDEAYKILKDCETEGLVHMVDNARGQVKHTCNCCGHYCWNVGIIRRRKIPRDSLMDVYFIRKTERDECIGCGACEEICPVDAVRIVDGKAEIDPAWCIGCGVCAVSCPTGAVSIVRRKDKAKAPKDFGQLHQRIREERGLG
ncbi:MAG: 4Fe-4S binding protein [Deltaproteobacteria bacterium]|nr:4Fe-4S binding protein [Deltaproteobacteria bacterium]